MCVLSICQRTTTTVPVVRKPMPTLPYKLATMCYLYTNPMYFLATYGSRSVHSKVYCEVLAFSLTHSHSKCVCVCVCVRERVREREKWIQLITIEAA